MTREELKAVVDCTTRYFSTVTPYSATIGVPFIKRKEQAFFLDYTGMIGISGSRKGGIYLTASGGMLWNLGHLILSEEVMEEELLMDIAGEVANTVAGNLREAFGPEFMISVPLVVRGVPDDLLIHVQSPVYIIPILWEGFQSFLGVGLDPA